MKFSLTSYGFISIDETSGVVTLQSSNANDASGSPYSVTVTAELANYSNVPSISHSFDVTIVNRGANEYSEDLCSPGYDLLLDQQARCFND